MRRQLAALLLLSVTTLVACTAGGADVTVDGGETLGASNDSNADATDDSDAPDDGAAAEDGGTAAEVGGDAEYGEPLDSQADCAHLTPPAFDGAAWKPGVRVFDAGRATVTLRCIFAPLETDQFEATVHVYTTFTPLLEDEYKVAEGDDFRVYRANSEVQAWVKRPGGSCAASIRLAVEETPAEMVESAALELARSACVATPGPTRSELDPAGPFGEVVAAVAAACPTIMTDALDAAGVTPESVEWKTEDHICDGYSYGDDAVRLTVEASPTLVDEAAMYRQCAFSSDAPCVADGQRFTAPQRYPDSQFTICWDEPTNLWVYANTDSPSTDTVALCDDLLRAAVAAARA